MAGIWVFAEGRDHTLELLSAAAGPAGALGVELSAFSTERQSAQAYIDGGADQVFLLPPAGADQPFEAYGEVLARVAADQDPDVIFIGATPRAKELAARLAARLGTGLCSECTGFELDGQSGRLQMQRMQYGGLAIQTVVCRTRPQMATIPPRTFEPAVGPSGRSGTVTEIDTAPSSPVRVLERAAKSRESVDITEAKIVVCVGRGVEKAEDIALARQLAEAIGGEVGCSRPIAEELNWLPEDVYLGISGKKIRPDLYIGVGVSGQVQHLSGIRDSRIIVAINRDENAPIFEAADYGIVGDLYQVVPKLIEAFSQTLNS